MKRAVHIGCFVAASGAFVVTAFDAAWWLLLGRRGRDFCAELDWYFADEHARLLALLAAEQTKKEQVA